MSVRAVFFDADGTLFESPEEIFARALAELGHRRSLDAVRAAYGRARPWYHANLQRYRGRMDGFWSDYNREVLRSLGEPDDADLARAVHEIFDRLEGTSLHGDVRGALEALKGRGLSLGVITNRARGALHEMLRVTGIDGFFTADAGMDDCHCFKPDVRLFRLALERAGCAAHEAVHVGDMYGEDVVGAQAAGMRAVLLQRDGGDAPDGEYERIASLTELPALLRDA